MRIRLPKWLASCAAASFLWVVIPTPAHAGWVTGVPAHAGAIRVTSEESPQHALIERVLADGSTASDLLLNGPTAFAPVRTTTFTDPGGRLPLGAAASGLATVFILPLGHDIAAKQLAAAVTTWQDMSVALGGPADPGFVSGTHGGSRLRPSLSGMVGASGWTGGGNSSPTDPGKPAFDVLLSDYRGDLTSSLAPAGRGADTFGSANSVGAVNTLGAGSGEPLVTPSTPGLPRIPTSPRDGGGNSFTPGSPESPFTPGPPGNPFTPESPGDTPPFDSVVSPYGLDPVPAPEPSSLTAAGIGIAGVLGYGWVRRRKGSVGEESCARGD